MKKKPTLSKKSKGKKTNITLRRRIGLVYKKIILFIKIILIILICLFCFTKYFTFIKLYLINNIYLTTARLGLKLENVIIEGQHNLEEASVINVINADKDSAILALNLYEIRNNLKKNSWVKDVYVGRRLPNTLYIRLFEREPIAIWQINNTLSLIDKEGLEITKKINPFSHLLHVVGIGANIYASKLIEELQKYPVLMNKSIVAVRVGNRRWDLGLKGDITVKMPEVGFEEALKYLNELNKANKLFDQNYKTLDLRDHNKHYIEEY